jgi:hypothetical protein
MSETVETIIALLKGLSCWIGFALIGLNFLIWHIIPDTWYGALIGFVFGFGWYFLFWNIWTRYPK